ncbi:MAG TPA: L,D-transpeptidase [Chthoniobacterales bacterium]
MKSLHPDSANPAGSADSAPPRTGIVVDIPTQTLRLEGEGLTPETFSISTSKFGIGTEPGSCRTPLGRFEIAEKIGQGQPAGMRYQSRIPTGEILDQGGEEDHVLTRILWLSGLEAENANTRGRYIYIHGTNQEALLGAPASHGCIRMRNADILRLFDAVAQGTPVQILA